MSKYEERWLKYVEEHPDFIQPASRRNEMINFVEAGSGRFVRHPYQFNWGIKGAFDPKHVVYVWFDAFAEHRPPLNGTDDKMFRKC